MYAREIVVIDRWPGTASFRDDKLWTRPLEQFTESGSMTLHFLRHDSEGEVLLVQGGNGEFAMIKVR